MSLNCYSALSMTTIKLWNYVPFVKCLSIWEEGGGRGGGLVVGRQAEIYWFTSPQDVVIKETS